MRSLRHISKPMLAKQVEADALLAAGKPVIEVAQLLSVSRRTITRWKRNFSEDKTSAKVGRRRKLTDEQLGELVRHLKTSNKKWTLAKISDWVRVTYQITVSVATLTRYAEKMKFRDLLSKKQESTILQVTHDGKLKAIKARFTDRTLLGGSPSIKLNNDTLDDCIRDLVYLNPIHYGGDDIHQVRLLGYDETRNSTTFLAMYCAYMGWCFVHERRPDTFDALIRCMTDRAFVRERIIDGHREQAFEGVILSEWAQALVHYAFRWRVAVKRVVIRPHTYQQRIARYRVAREKALSGIGRDVFLNLKQRNRWWFLTYETRHNLALLGDPPPKEVCFSVEIARRGAPDFTLPPSYMDLVEEAQALQARWGEIVPRILLDLDSVISSVNRPKRRRASRSENTV